MKIQKKPEQNQRKKNIYLKKKEKQNRAKQKKTNKNKAKFQKKNKILQSTVINTS